MSIPDDDLNRQLMLADPDDSALPHVAAVGGTYTILVSGKDTDGRYCLIDMLVPEGDGPAPHRHDFDEMFTVLEGGIEATFRGQTRRAAKAQPSTSRPMRRTASRRHPASLRQWFACARPPDRRSFSSRSGRLSKPGPPLRRG